MCDVVFLNKEIKQKMKTIYPKNVPDEYFDAYQEMVEDYVKETKADHEVRKLELVGFKGLHDIIYGTFLDAIMVRPKFVKIFGGC